MLRQTAQAGIAGDQGTHGKFMGNIKIGKGTVQRCRRSGIFQHEAFAKKGWIAQACGKIEIIDPVFSQIDQAFAVEIDAASQQDRPTIERPVVNAHTGF